MRFAIFSDVHANLQAWEAVLADIQSQGVDTLVCLGDVIGYGPMPGPVLESVYQHTDNFVLGNHDAVVGGRIDAATFNDHARYVIEWTAEQLGDDGAAFFAQVPLTLRGEKMLFTHGDAARPGHFDYVVKAEDARPSFQSCKDQVIFFGHTHDPGVFACANTKGIIDKLPGTDVVLKRGRRYMVNPGSVGDPRSAADLRASYCIYDDTTRRVIFRKVKFDVEGYRADLAESGLEMTPYFLRVIDAGSRRPEEEEELAMVQDHREEVEVDESMTAQPRALVTAGSPMANRAKLHFGYTHPQQQGHPTANPQTRRIQSMPVPPKSGSNFMLIMIIGLLLGGIGVMVVLMMDFSQTGGDDSPKAEKPELLDEDEGWVNPDKPEPKESEPEPEPVVVNELPKPAPVFSLGSEIEQPFEKYGIGLPDGVGLVDTKFGGQGLAFKAGTVGVRVPPVDALDFTGSISIAAWVKVEKSSLRRYIYLRREGSKKSIYLYVTSTRHKNPSCVVFGGDAVPEKFIVRTSSRKPIDDGEWHFVMGMYDQKEGKIRIYLDGVISRSRNWPSDKFPHSGGDVLIGEKDFGGEIYGLRVYDWPLHTREMKQLYDSGK